MQDQPQPQPIESRIKPFNEDLRAGIDAYKKRHALSLTQLATQLGTNPTQVSKYISGKPEGNVPQLESIIADVLDNEIRRKNSVVGNFTTSVSSSIFGILDMIRETNDIALLSGPAGIGKTCAIQLYCDQNKSTIHITVTAWMCGAISSLLCRAVSTRARPTNMSAGEYLREKLTDSNRLIIVDNAHKLSRYSLAWLFDFADQTNCPIALVGNPEILTRIKSNDQWFSRIGIHKSIALSEGAARRIAIKIINQLIPEAGDELESIGEIIGENHGHFRALRKQCILARKYMEKKDPDIKTWSKAFGVAHTMLIRNYTLTAEITQN
jgi:DNA transposition AAA+ family ATPase